MPAMQSIRILCCLLMVMTSVACSKSTSHRSPAKTVEPNNAPNTKPREADNPLNRFLGSWSVSTAIHQPNEADIISEGEDRCQWLGTSGTMVCTYKTKTGQFNALSVRSWDSTTGVVSGYWMTSDNKNGPLRSTGTYNRLTNTLDELEVGLDPNGNPVKLHMVRTYSSDDAGVVKYTVVKDDGSEVKAFTSTLKRTSK